MPLPLPNTPWPPTPDRYRRMATNATWYGGDPARLAAMYRADLPLSGESRKERRLLGVIHDWFWGQSDPNEPDDKVHVPVAEDIARMSADLLFASAPTFTVTPPPGYVAPQRNATDPVAQAQDTAMDAAVKAAQERLDYIVDQSGLEATLVAAAETQAALGGVALRIGWESGMPTPTITRVDADAVVGEWSMGMLQAVTFWEVLERKDAHVIYHLERHERGGVWHGLYRGTHDNLGKRLGLAEHPNTAYLATRVNAEGWMPLVDGMLCATIVPNMLPDPLDRMSLAGRSDYSPGALTLFDAVDKAASSLMRDIDDGRSRIMVADYMLESRGVGKGVEFNQDQHVFTPLALNPGENGDAPITSIQFKIRVDEHLRTIDALARLAVEKCGYNPDSDNGEGGAAMTATEYQGRNRKSVSTRTKKARYWKAAMEPLLTALLAFDAKYVNRPTPALPVVMELAPAQQDSMNVLAGTAEVLARAKAASRRTLVELVHPDWEPEQVDDEVQAILAEEQVGSPDMVPSYDQSVVPTEADAEVDADPFGG